MNDRPTALQARPEHQTAVTTPMIDDGWMIPKSFSEAKEIGEYLCKSDLVPKEMRDKPADVVIAMQMGIDVGLKPMQALQNIAVINGRPCMWGDAVLAIVKANPHFEFINEQLSEYNGTTRSDFQKENVTAFCTVKRRGEEPITRHFSVQDAITANLWSKSQSPWINYPVRMLQMRARSWAIRDAFPDVLKGIAVREEAQDIQSVERVTIDNDLSSDDLNAGLLAAAQGRGPSAPAGEAEQTASDAASTSSPGSAGARTDTPQRAVELQHVLGKMELAEQECSESILKDAGELAKALEKDEDKKEARARYKKASAAIKTAANEKEKVAGRDVLL